MKVENNRKKADKKLEKVTKMNESRKFDTSIEKNGEMQRIIGTKQIIGKN